MAKWMKVKEVSEYLNVSYNTALKVAKKAGAFFKVVNCARVDREKLDNYVYGQNEQETKV